MQTKIIKLNLITPLRSNISGMPSLLSGSSPIVPSDTIWSAICNENVQKIERYKDLAEKGDLIFSDALPFVKDALLIPKPQVKIPCDFDNYKALKKLKFVPLSSSVVANYDPQSPSSFCALVAESINLEKQIGTEILRTRASISRTGEEDTVPYTISAFEFNENSGLYILVNAKDENIFNEFLCDIKAQGIVGFGGRKSSGWGKFEVANFGDFDVPKGDKFLLLSTALPSENEMEVLSDEEFKIFNRNGFASVTNNNDKLVRRKNIFAIASGAIFKKKFKGCVAVVTPPNMPHSVYRFLTAFFVPFNGEIK